MNSGQLFQYFIKAMWRLFLLFLFISISCKNQNGIPTLNAEYCSKDIFVFTESNTLFKTDNSVDGGSLNTKIKLIGKIHDTGTINMFYVYESKTGFVLQKRFFVEERIFKEKFRSKWCEIEGVYTKTGKDKIEIGIQKIKEVKDLESIFSQSKSQTLNWFNNNRQNLNLNEYKKTQRFQKALKQFSRKDLNSLPFQSDSTITFIDYNNSTVGIYLGHHILNKTDQRKDFITFHGIYNFKINSIQNIYIQNTGEFLE